VAFYFGPLPLLTLTDPIHTGQVGVKNLRNPNLNLTLWVDDEDQKEYTISDKPLRDLLKHSQDTQTKCPYTLSDLKFLHQTEVFRVNSAQRIFHPRTVELLREHNIENHESLSLFSLSTYSILCQFLECGLAKTITDAVRLVIKGMMFFIFWWVVLELKRLRVNSGRPVRKDPSKKGRFITRSYFRALYLCMHFVIWHILTCYRHFRHRGPGFALHLHRCGTQENEQMQSQFQGKTTQLQSTNVSPSVADIVQGLGNSELAFQFESEIRKSGGPSFSSPSRQKQQIKCQTFQESLTYKYPPTEELLRIEMWTGVALGEQDAKEMMEGTVVGRKMATYLRHHNLYSIDQIANWAKKSKKKLIFPFASMRNERGKLLKAMEPVADFPSAKQIVESLIIRSSI